MDAARVKAIYDEINTLVIELEADPVTLGTQYLNNLIACCRNYLNRCSSILLEVSREKRDVAARLRAEEAAYQVSFDELLATDERVRVLPNIEDRRSTINVFLRDQRNSIEALKRELQDLEYVEKAVRHRHNELKSTNTDIKMQRQMVRDELDTGAFYGDEGDGVVRKMAQRKPEDDLDENAIDQILKGHSIAGSVTLNKEDQAEVDAATTPEEPKAVEPKVDAPPVNIEEENEVAIEEALKAALTDSTPPTVESPAPVVTKEPEVVTKTVPMTDEDAINAFLATPQKTSKVVEEIDDDVFAGLTGFSV